MKLVSVELRSEEFIGGVVYSLEMVSDVLIQKSRTKKYIIVSHKIEDIVDFYNSRIRLFEGSYERIDDISLLY